MTQTFLSVGEVAARINVPSRTISHAFYQGVLNKDRCPLVGGRRLVPSNYVRTIATILRERQTGRG